MWRPGWSNLAAPSTCPASHLMVLKRTLALEEDLYSADHARGSHDWDSALGLQRELHTSCRCPRMHGWRMHPGSAALAEDSKDHLLNRRSRPTPRASSGLTSRIVSRSSRP